MWDGIKRRADDMGKETPEVTLARIDENVQFLKAGAEVVRVQLDRHERDDDVKFKDLWKNVDGVKRNVWVASGAVGMLIFIIHFFQR